MKKIKLSDLTLREKIGQTLIISTYRWAEVENRKEFLERTPVGGLWSYSGAPSKTKVDVVDFTDGEVSDDSSVYAKPIAAEMAKYMKVPPVVGADSVSGFCDLSKSLTTMTFGATGDVSIAERHGKAIANEFRCAGVHWRWSPIGDLCHRDSAGHIGRAYSDDCDTLADMCIAYVKGSQENGVAACMKHFPGCGIYSTRDTHLVPSVNTMTLEEWEKTQGAVYQKIIDSGVWSVMNSHTAFPAVDDTKIGKKYLPATFSKKIITDLLKGKMHFDGVVISDDMNMRGAKNFFSVEDTVINALNAGIDMYLGYPTKDVPDYIDLVEKAVLDGRIPMERIDDACQRVLNFKEKIGLFNEGFFDKKESPKDAYAETQELYRETCEKAITLVANDIGLLPLNKEKIKNISIIAFAHVPKFYTAMDSLKEKLEARGYNVKVYDVLSRELMQEIDRNSDLIIYAMFLGAHAPFGASSFYGDVMKSFFNVLSFGEEKSICVSFGSTNIFYDYFEYSDTFINAYTYDEHMLDTFVKAIFGEIPFKGVSPIKLIP